MLYRLGVAFLIIWLLGVLAFYTIGGIVPILIVSVMAMVVVSFFSARSAL